MTLPLTTILPLHSADIKKGGDSLDKYMRELVFSLQRQYEDVAQAVNGDIRRSTDSGSVKFTPTVRGSTAEGAGTYSRQIAWVLREGLMVDYWFDIAWTAHTGTGTIQVNLPYQCAQTDSNLFVCPLFTETITFTGNPYGVANTGLRTMDVRQSRSAAAFASITMINAATIRGCIRYVGQEIERS